MVVRSQMMRRRHLAMQRAAAQASTPIVVHKGVTQGVAGYVLEQPGMRGPGWAVRDRCSVRMQAATSRSIVALDELGRGTATTDGAAVASAVLQHLASNVGCRWLTSMPTRARRPPSPPSHCLVMKCVLVV